MADYRVLPNGTKEWYVDGLRHRLDGPAYERTNGYKEWWVNGLRHRLDGPAILWPDGSYEWYVDGKKVDIMAVFGYVPSVPLTEDEQMVLRLST